MGEVINKEKQDKPDHCTTIKKITKQKINM